MTDSQLDRHPHCGNLALDGAPRVAYASRPSGDDPLRKMRRGQGSPPLARARHPNVSLKGEGEPSFAPELTIAGLLGHSARGVTQGYIHLDARARCGQMLDGVTATQRKIQKHFATAIAA